MRRDRRDSDRRPPPEDFKEATAGGTPTNLVTDTDINCLDFCPVRVPPSWEVAYGTGTVSNFLFTSIGSTYMVQQHPATPDIRNPNYQSANIRQYHCLTGTASRKLEILGSDTDRLLKKCTINRFSLEMNLLRLKISFLLFFCFFQRRQLSDPG